MALNKLPVRSLEFCSHDSIARTAHVSECAPLQLCFGGQKTRPQLSLSMCVARKTPSGALATDSAAVNALRVLMEPRLRLNDLTEAREQIDKALEKLRSTSWPTDSDYRDYDFS